MNLGFKNELIDASIFHEKLLSFKRFLPSEAFYFALTLIFALLLTVFVQQIKLA